MIALSHKVILRIKKSAVIKITNAAAGEAAKQSGIVWCDFEEVSHSKGSKRRKPVHDGAPPRGIGTIRAKEVQKTINEGSASFQHLLSMIGSAVTVNPCP